MMTSQNIEVIAIDQLLDKVQHLKNDNYRLVQIGCTTLAEGLELHYSFDKDFKMINLRLLVQPQQEVPSITRIYFAAFGYENEVKDLFGVNVKGNMLDYLGAFYQTAIKTPFAANPATGEKHDQ